MSVSSTYQTTILIRINVTSICSLVISDICEDTEINFKIIKLCLNVGYENKSTIQYLSEFFHWQHAKGRILMK